MFENQNNLESEAFKKRFGVLWLNELVFDAGATKWMKKRLKKLKKDPDFEAQNHWTKALFEEDFRKKSCPAVEIREVNSIIGLGVFAKETLRALTYVGEYAGVVRRRKRKEDDANSYVFRYLDTRFRVPYVVDAKEQGNLCRFLNHSDNPNLISRSIVIDDTYHIIFFTKRACQKGEQLTYDYGPFYWRKRPHPLPIWFFKMLYNANDFLIKLATFNGIGPLDLFAWGYIFQNACKPYCLKKNTTLFPLWYFMPSDIFFNYFFLHTSPYLLLSFYIASLFDFVKVVFFLNSLILNDLKK